MYSFSAASSYSNTFTATHCGQYTITAIDNCGLTSTKNVIVADVTAPTQPIVITSNPSLNSQCGIRPPILQISSTELTGDTGVGSFKYTLNNGTQYIIDPSDPGTVAPVQISLNSIGGTYTYTSANIDLSTLKTGASIPSGNYTIDLWATDNAHPGNVLPPLSNSSLHLSIPQKILNAFPKEPSWPTTSNSGWYNQKLIQIIEKDDLDGLIPTTVASSDQSKLQYLANITNPPATWNWDTGTSVQMINGITSISLSEGKNSICIGTMDQAGNSAIFGPYIFSIDTTPPVISAAINGIPITSQTTAPYYTNANTPFTINMTDPLPNGVTINSGINQGTKKYSTSYPAPDFASEQGWTPYTDGSSAVKIQDFNCFRGEQGRHTYTFIVEDNAKNFGSLSFALVYNSVALSLVKENDGTLDNLEYIPISGTATKINANQPFAGKSIEFSFPVGGTPDQPCYGGPDQQGNYSYAPPQAVSVSFTDVSGVATAGKTYNFSSDTNGNYTSAQINFSDFNGLPDGAYTLNYTITDASGLSRNDSLPISLHNAPPSPIATNSISRTSPISGGGNYWRQPSSGPAPWTVSYGDLTAITDSTAGLDGISVDYTDAAAPTSHGAALFPLSAYSFKVADSAKGNASTVASLTTTEITTVGCYWTGTSLVYLFNWGSESSRDLTLTVTDEAGLSTNTMIHIVKPVWGSFTASSPIKSAGQGAFSVVWSDETQSPDWTKGLRWDNKSRNGSDYTDYICEGASGQAVLSPSTVAPFGIGDTLDIRPVMDNRSGFTPIEVQGPSTTVYVPYEALPNISLPTNTFLGAGTASQVSIAAIATNASDGTSIQYALAITAQNSNGTKTEYFPYSAQYQGFPCSLWSLFGLSSGTDASSLAALSAALQASTLTASIVAWYGDPLASPSFAEPSYKQGAFNATIGPLPTWPLANPIQLKQSGPSSSVGWDVTPPTATLTGTLSNPNEIANTLVISGSATDSGGSGLNSVVVSYRSVDATGAQIGTVGLITIPLTIDANGNFSYTLNTSNNVNDGFYSIQVIATDNAGNQSTNSSIMKLLDTHAPLLDQFQFSQAATAGNVQASANGTVTANITIDDGNGTGLPGSGLSAVEYRWEDAQGTPLSQGSTAAWGPAMNPPVFSQYDKLHAGPESFTVTFGNVVNGTAYLHYKLLDKAGNESSDMTAPQTVSYSATAPNVRLTVSGWTTAGGQNWIRNASSLIVGYTPADSTQSNVVASAQWNVQLVNADGSFQDDSAS